MRRGHSSSARSAIPLELAPSALEHEANERGVREATGMTVGSRFMRLREYIEDVLASTLRERRPDVLSRAQKQLAMLRSQDTGPSSI
jgi:hypothetical protein